MAAKERKGLDENAVPPTPVSFRSVTRQPDPQDTSAPANQHTGKPVNSFYPPHSYRFRPELHTAIRILATRQGRDIGEMVGEALEDLLRKYGEPIPAEGQGAR